ncbi:MAG: hypothetical protein HC769_37335, partial [Cyanobacteria bacterium CRU_2_1]|nr:hypothetical protein [Cyanobacteria bacterium CRU_2_1]
APSQGFHPCNPVLTKWLLSAEALRVSRLCFFVLSIQVRSPESRFARSDFLITIRSLNDTIVQKPVAQLPDER